MKQRERIENFSGVILAGGKNSRYGGFSKAFLRINNRFIVEKTIDLFKTLFPHTLIIANDPELYTPFGIEVYPDIYPDRGPIGGLHSALSHAQTPHLFVVACDMPALQEELIRRICIAHQSRQACCTVPERKGFLEPLHAAYSISILPALEARLLQTDDNSLHRFIRQNSYQLYKEPLNSQAFISINSPDDLAKYNSRF